LQSLQASAAPGARNNYPPDGNNIAKIPSTTTDLSQQRAKKDDVLSNKSAEALRSGGAVSSQFLEMHDHVIVEGAYI
jgi:hypothetical protein